MENNLGCIKKHYGLILESRLENLDHRLHMLSFMVKDKEFDIWRYLERKDHFVLDMCMSGILIAIWNPSYIRLQFGSI